MLILGCIALTLATAFMAHVILKTPGRWTKYLSYPALLMMAFCAGGFMWFDGYKKGSSESIGYPASQNEMVAGATYKKVSQFHTMYGLRATITVEPNGRLRLYEMEDDAPEFFTVVEETRYGIFRKYVVPSK